MRRGRQQSWRSSNLTSSFSSSALLLEIDRSQSGCESSEKADNLPRNKLAMVFERKVTRVEQVQLRLRNVAQIRLSAFDREEGIILAPHDQCLRLLVTEERVPFVVMRQICLIVVQQVQL